MKSTAIAGAAWLALAVASSAGVNQWAPLGPYGPGGNVHVIAVDPSASSIIYAATDAGVFKTTDGGLSWASASVGLVSLSVQALAIDPATPTTLYAAHSLFWSCGISRSIDGGASWSSASAGFDGACPSALAIDPQARGTLYAVGNIGSSGTDVFTDIFFSTDGAAHWNRRGRIGDTGVASLVIVPTQTSTLYATANGGVWKSLDAAATWSSVNQGLTGLYFGPLALDSATPATLYAASQDGVFKTTDAAHTWFSASAGLPSGSPYVLAVDSSFPPTVLAATATGVFRTTDGAMTWKLWAAGGAIPAQALAMAPGHVAYAGTASGGSACVFRKNGEDRWQALDTAFLPVPMVALAGGATASTLYGATNEEAYKTVDDGEHWTRLASPLPNSNGVTKLIADPATPGALYLATFSGVFASTDDGASWASRGPLNQAVYSILIDPKSPGTLYAGAYPQRGDPPQGGIWKTMDGGASWAQVDSLGNDYPVSFAIDPSNSATILAGTYYGVILKSTDAGATWRQVKQSYGAVASIVIDPQAPNRVAVSFNGTLSPIGFPAGNVAYSEDGGETWSMASGLPCCGIAGLVMDPVSRDLYVGVAGQTFTSADHGAAWTPVGPAGGPWPSVLAREATGFPTLYGIGLGGVSAMTVVRTGPCEPGTTTLCLQGGRFRVTVGWQRTPSGPTYRASAEPVTSESGYFWFFDPDNVELMVKVLDGTPANGYFWVFSGALSNVAYTITVTDTLTGASKTYVNPKGQLASLADTTAFPGTNPPSSTVFPPLSVPFAAGASPPSSACSRDPFTLCLDGGRFQVQAFWQLSPSGPSILARVGPLTAVAGYFWFFDDANVELVVKVLDATPVNGHYWVFSGALSSVEYTISVTDTVTGAVQIYHNARGSLASMADTSAF